MKKIFSLLLLSAVMITGCKKDDAPAPDTSVTVDANGNVTPPSDAAGAMYAIYTKTYNDNSGSAFDPFQFGYAWFGSYAAALDAGTVTGNTIPLDNLFNQYFTTDPTITMFDPATGSVAWNVQGNSGSGVAGFTHTDNTPFPSGAEYTLPASINISSNYTLSHTATTNADAVVYTVIGNNGQKNKAVNGNSSSVTFTAAEMNEVAFAHDQIGFSIMPVKITSAVYNGKKYYFVKQYQVQRETTTL